MKHNEYWFKPKRFGYGEEPCTWEGWLVVLGFIVLILGVSFLVKPDEENIIDYSGNMRGILP